MFESTPDSHWDESRGVPGLSRRSEGPADSGRLERIIACSSRQTSIATGKLKRKTIIRDNCLCPNTSVKALLPPISFRSMWGGMKGTPPCFDSWAGEHNLWQLNWNVFNRRDRHRERRICGGGVRKWLCVRSERREGSSVPWIKEETGRSRGENREERIAEWRAEITAGRWKGPKNCRKQKKQKSYRIVKQAATGAEGLSEEAGLASGARKWNLGRTFKGRSSAEHGFMPALTHWVNLLLPGGDPWTSVTPGSNGAQSETARIMLVWGAGSRVSVEIRAYIGQKTRTICGRKRIWNKNKSGPPRPRSRPPKANLSLSPLPDGGDPPQTFCPDSIKS